MAIVNLEWDSNFFGLRIGKISPNNIEEAVRLLKLAKQLNFDLIYSFNNADEIEFSSEILKKNRGKKVDTKVTFKWIVNNENIFDSSGTIEYYQNNNISADLLQLVFQSGIYSRFNLDKNFKSSSFKKLYTKWIIKSLNDSNSYILVQKHLDKIIGFISIDIYQKQNYSNIGLIAVSSEFRGKNIGSNLLNEAKKITKNLHLNYLSVPTQKDNINACNFYIKNNFQLFSAVDIHHFWIKSNR